MTRTLTACCLTLTLGLLAPQAPLAKAYTGGEAVDGGASAAAFAPGRVPGAAQQRSPIDLDGDGSISEEEARRYYRWIFTYLDSDRDGIVTKSEFVAVLAPRGAQLASARREARLERLDVLFGRLDKDGDDQLAQREFMGACDDHFATADVDGDGEVSLYEFRSRRPL